MAAVAELSARGDTDVSDELVKVEQLRERAGASPPCSSSVAASMERDRGQ